MVTLDMIRKPVEGDLEAFEQFIRQKFTADGTLLSEMLDYALSARGKGIRPMTVLLSAALNAPAGQRSGGLRTLLAATLVEMIHVASLIHDDVIDESDMRRGRASVNARWREGIIQLTFGAGSRFRSLIWQLLSVRTDSSPDPDSVFAHLLLSLFVEVDLAVVGSSAKQVIVPDIIVAIQSYLDRNYSRNISLDDLSRIFSISKFHMSREFKRYVGKSPNDYLIGIRLDKAKVLLVDSRRSIAEIGQLVGIPNTNHFLYLFKSREGITPSAFRKQRI